MTFMESNLKSSKSFARAVAGIILLTTAIVLGNAVNLDESPKGCAPPAHIGCSVPKPKELIAPPVTASQTFPDISEYQGCPTISSPVIFKIWEEGYGLDHSALCNARQVRAKHLYAGVYAFLRPGNPVAQADHAVGALKAVGGVSGPLVADAEVPLPPGFVSGWLNRIRHDLPGRPVFVYTSPGTWPGGPLTARLWVATYGPRPGCVAGVCSHAGWQFSDNYMCRGIKGDCSINYGIVTRPPQPKPINPNAAKIAYLRVLAHRHNCYRKGKKPHACKVWGAEVRILSAG